MESFASLFAPVAPSSLPARAAAPAVAGKVQLITPTSAMPGLTPEVLNAIFGKKIPKDYTKTQVIEAAVAYVEEIVYSTGSLILRRWPAWLYHCLPFIGSTLIKNYADNPKTCRDPFEASDDVNIGSGIHAYSLQGAVGLDTECVIMPTNCHGKSVASLENRALFARHAKGKVCLPPLWGAGPISKWKPMLDVLHLVDYELRNHPFVGDILKKCETELTLIWIDERSGLICKARLDIWEPGECEIYDLKKTAAIARFKYQVRDLFYNLQAGHYFNGAVACGLKPRIFGFIAVEAVYPFLVAPGIRLPENMDRDRSEAVRMISLIKESQLTDKWPNYRVPENLWSLSEVEGRDLLTEW